MVSPEDRDRILQILHEGKYVETRGANPTTVIDFGGPVNKAWAFAFAQRMGRNIGNPSECPPCNIEAANELRKAVGWPILVDTVPPNIHTTRLRMCQGDGTAPKCPAYHTTTHSCGRLIVDAITPKPIKVDGRMIEPCGCEVDLKARFASQQCPAGRWPTAA